MVGRCTSIEGFVVSMGVMVLRSTSWTLRAPLVLVELEECIGLAGKVGSRELPLRVVQVAVLGRLIVSWVAKQVLSSS